MTTLTSSSNQNTTNAYYVLLALLPGLVCTLLYAGLKREDVAIFYSDFSAIIKISISAVAALLIESIVLAIRRQPILSIVKNPQALFIGLLLALLLPNHLQWWQITLVIAAAIIIGRHLLNNYLHASLTGYLFALAILPSAMGLAIFIKSELYNSYMLKINGAFALGGLFLIYKRFINWRMPLGILTVYFSLALLYQLLYSGLPISITLINSLFTPTTCLSAFFIAPFIINTTHDNQFHLACGVVIGISLFVFTQYGQYPDPLAFILLAFNAIAFAIKARHISIHHTNVSVLSSHVWLVPILSAAMVMINASSIISAALTGVAVSVIYLASHSVADVLHRHLPQHAIPSLVIVLTVFFSTYIVLSIEMYLPQVARSLDNPTLLFTLSSLILSFSAVFTGDTTSFKMTNGLKTSGLFFILVLLIGTINQFTKINHLLSISGLFVLAFIALCNNKKLSTVNTPNSKPNRRVRATGIIK